MSLPRYVENKFKKISVEDRIVYSTCAGFARINLIKGSCNSAIKFGFKFWYRHGCEFQQNELEKWSGQSNTPFDDCHPRRKGYEYIIIINRAAIDCGKELLMHNGLMYSSLTAFTWCGKHVKEYRYCRFARDKIRGMVRKINDNRTKQIFLQCRCEILSQKIYKSRSFPPMLRQTIFERDNFTCQNCGKHRDALVEDGLHLEVDHIIEWEDGGETKLDNGKTICSRCNKAKHHYKKYKQLS